MNRKPPEFDNHEVSFDYSAQPRPAYCAPDPCACERISALPPSSRTEWCCNGDEPLPVWGWADAGATVTDEFNGQKRSATTDAIGNWQVKLDAMKALNTGQKMFVVCGDDSKNHRRGSLRMALRSGRHNALQQRGPAGIDLHDRTKSHGHRSYAQQMKIRCCAI